jgi:hypothetical protein
MRDTAGSSLHKFLIEIVIVAVSALFLSVYLTRPMAFNTKDHAIDLGDSRLNAYLQAWVAHSVASDPRHLFDTNMFYPAKGTLALSENMLGNQLIFGPVYAVTKNPIWASNCVILVSFWLCALCMYLLVRYLTGSPWPAGIAGFVFAFAPVRLSQMGHMQLMSMEWMPLSVLFLYRFLVRRNAASLIASGGFVALQILCSLYLGYIEALILLTTLSGVVLTMPHLMLSRKAIVCLGLSAIAVAGILFPVMVPYLRLQHGGVLLSEFDVGNTIAGSANPITSYLHGEFGSRHIYAHWLSRFDSKDLGWEKVLFPGFVPILLSIVAIAGSFMPQCRYKLLEMPPNSGLIKKPHNAANLWSSAVAGSSMTVVASYLLTLGPYLRIHDQPSRIKMPYFWLQRWIPGMGEFRVPARFGLGLMFGLAILAGAGFLYLLRIAEHWPVLRDHRAKAVLTGLALLFMIQEFDFTPFHLDPVMTPSTVAPEYRWLAKQPPGSPTLELPITKYGSGFDPFEAAGYIYASSFHWQPLFNGYSGHLPLIYSQVERWARKMPSASSVDLLRVLGLRYVVLHMDKMPAKALEEWQSGVQQGGLIEITRFGPTLVYQLASSPNCSSQMSDLTLGMQAPKIAEVGKQFRFLLSVYSPKGCWVDSLPLHAKEIEGEWIGEHSGNVTRFATWVDLPPTLADGETQLVSASAQEPAPGTYKFRILSLDSKVLQLSIEKVILTALPLSTSINSPRGLSAEYKLKALSPIFRAGSKGKVEFYTRNTGTAVWLSNTPSPAGSVALGYSWRNANGKEVKTGRIFLEYPVYPGTDYTFTGAICAPDDPGNYVLSLELVSELVAWFHDVGVKPVNVTLTVSP